MDTGLMAQQLDGDPDARAWQACIKYAFHLIEDQEGSQAVRSLTREIAKRYPRGYDARCEIARMLEDKLRRGAKVTAP